MTDRDCSRIAERLVEYSDGELSPGESQEVAQHLARCPECQRALRALQRSLELARGIWEEDASAAKGAPAIRDRGRSGATRVLVALLALAAVALLAAGLYSWRAGVRRPRGLSTAGEKQAARNPHRDFTGDVREKPQADLDVVAFIEREARRAKLLASAQLLGEQPALHEYKLEAEQYLAEAYGNSALPRPDQE
jgi:anti-sigma factor RsiW